MSETNHDPEGTWECDWAGHELAQLRRLAELPFWEKLEWLEEAQRMAEHMQSTRSTVPPTQVALGPPTA